MTLERVEPNVVRVLDDGAGHDLTDPNTFEDLKPASLFAAGDDGGGLDFAWRDETTLTFGVLEPGAEAWTSSPLPPLPLASADGYMAVERTPNGQLWVAEGPWWYEEQRNEPGPLWTFEASAWRSVEPLGHLPVRPMSLVVEPAGTLRVGWQEVTPGLWGPDATWHTTRHDDDGEWSVVELVEDEAAKRRGWCTGYAHIDGERLTRYLDGKCLRPVAITPTGEVWAFGTNRNRKKHGVYIITPDR